MDEFSATIWQYYKANARPMPWRDNHSFYFVLVSELMLQQTQVSRVMPKFNNFIQRFPTTEALAAASLGDVLREWVGLGYNRRAKYLHEASKIVAAQGVPRTLAGLMALPGVGKNTAAAIMNYAYNVGVPFVETNIRTVYLATFFAGQAAVTDAEIIDKVAETMDTHNPREWFWALMDYGAFLKGKGEAHLARSRHYKTQSPLKGSLREMRGAIIAALAKGDTTKQALFDSLDADDRFPPALQALKTEGLVAENAGILHLTK